MNPFLIFITGMFVGMLVAWLGRRVKVERAVPPLIERQAEDKEKNKAKILDAFISRGRMAQDSVMDILDVSEATATRYLDELEHEGYIRQLGGDTGRGVYYERISNVS
jgi:predicted HTH transcriptional regulator